MADEPEDPMTPLGGDSKAEAEATEARHQEHLEAVGAADGEVADLTDTEQWRTAPKDGGGA